MAGDPSARFLSHLGANLSLKVITQHINGGRRARGETFTFEWKLSVNYNNKASPGGCCRLLN